MDRSRTTNRTFNRRFRALGLISTLVFLPSFSAGSEPIAPLVEAEVDQIGSAQVIPAQFQAALPIQAAPTDPTPSVDAPILPTTPSPPSTANAATTTTTPIQSTPRPPSRLVSRLNRTPTRPLGFSSTPFMIGDTGAGACATLSPLGGLVTQIEHPTLVCSRLNVAENNSAILSDRVYLSYRHFHNATRTRVINSSSAMSIDRVTIGAERTFGGGDWSVEVRIPMSREFSSDFDVIVDDADASRNTIPLSDRNAEFGNVSAIVKASLLQTERFQLTSGIAVLFPTANDLNVHGDLDSTLPVVANPTAPNPALFQQSDIEFDVFVENESFNVSPFLAFAFGQSRRLYYQGFLQFDLSTNPSDFNATVQGDVFPFLTPPVTPLAPIAVDFHDQARLHQQTLVRMNLGCGYELYRGCWRRDEISLTGLLELHYTSTLQDAKRYQNTILNYDYLGDPIPLELQVGNGSNRNDVLNIALGSTARLAKTALTTGVVFPLRTGDDKPFDAEINVQLQRRF